MTELYIQEKDRNTNIRRTTMMTSNSRCHAYRHDYTVNDNNDGDGERSRGSVSLTLTPINYIDSNLQKVSVR